MIRKMSRAEVARVRVHYQWRDPETTNEYEDDCAMADMQMARPVIFAENVAMVSCPECLRRRLWERVIREAA